MSSVDLSDAHIIMAYDALMCNDPLRWFLLAYGNRAQKPTQLTLCASGTGDLEELRAQLTPGNVHFGMFREHSHDKSLHVAVSYIPDSVGGVRRARALAHAWSFSSKFKAHQVLNVSNSEQVTVDALRTALRLPPRGTNDAANLGLGAPPSSTMFQKPSSDFRSASLFASPTPTGSPAHARSTSSPLSTSVFSTPQLRSDAPSQNAGNGAPDTAPAPTNRPPPLSLANIKTATAPETGWSLSPISSSLTHSPLPVSSPASGSHFLPSPQHASWLAKQDAPLPPPPAEAEKDAETEAEAEAQHGEDSSARPISPRMGFIPDSHSVASRRPSVRVPTPPLAHPPSNGSAAPTIDGLPQPSLSALPPRTAAQEEAFRSRAKWTTQRDAPEDEEEKRLAVLEEERRRRASERARREREAREEDEAREREFEARKERERVRRVESARKAEERRVEERKRREVEQRQRAEERAQREAEARARRSRVQERFERRPEKGMDLLTGFVTLETAGNWKRRFFRLSTEEWVFFRSDQDITQPVQAIELARVRALREWHEGYEELEAIVHSFAVELKDDAPCLFFADSAEDKEVLLGLLTQAAGL